MSAALDRLGASLSSAFSLFVWAACHLGIAALTWLACEAWNRAAVAIATAHGWSWEIGHVLALLGPIVCMGVVVGLVALSEGG